MISRIALKVAFALFIPAVLFAANDPKSLNISFQKQKDPEVLRQEAELLAEKLSAKLGIPVNARVPLDYSAPTQALISKTADVAYLDSVSFVLAKRDGASEILLAEKRPDINGTARTDYDSIFVVAKAGPVKDFKWFLENTKNLRVSFTSPTSTSGYLFPYKRLVEEGLLTAGDSAEKIFKSVSFGGSYARALMEVVEGRADVCAVSNYAFEGAVADSYLPSEKRDKLRILERNPGVPTHVIANRAGLSAEFKARLKQAILEISNEQPEIFEDVYGATNFTEVDSDKHVQATSKALELLKMN